MANLPRITKDKTTNNLIIGAAVVVAAIAGYFILTGSKSATTKTGTGTGTGSNTGTGTGTGAGTKTTPTPAASTCSASDAEFPLVQGYGSSGRANMTCERVYVKNIQTVINQFLAQDRLTLLTVDGQFGAKTAAAIMQYYGGFNYISKAQYTSMLDYLVAGPVLDPNEEYVWSTQNGAGASW